MNPFIKLFDKDLSDEAFELKVKELIDAGKDINQVKDGKTALDVAMSFDKYLAKVKILKKHSAKQAQSIEKATTDHKEAVIASYAKAQTLTATTPSQTEISTQFSMPLESFSGTYTTSSDRKFYLGDNPNVGDDKIVATDGGKNNIVCKMVLSRWASKGKARYIGIETNLSKKINDWANWQVKVKIKDSGDREWVLLSLKDERGRICYTHGTQSFRRFLLGLWLFCRK